MKQDNTVYWLWLAMVFGAGNEKVHVLLRSVESCKALYYNLHDPDQSGLTEKERQRVKRTTLTQAEGVMAACEQKGIGILTWESEIYPASLRHIYAPPIVLFYRGDPGILERQMMLTVVGTRHPSAYSLRVADTFCENLAKCNVILVSGCAVGLDAAAHKAAIRAGVPTIAVLGCGVDYDYPRENRALKEQIVQNGLLLSEYFPGTQPLPAMLHREQPPLKAKSSSYISVGPQDTVPSASVIQPSPVWGMPSGPVRVKSPSARSWSFQVPSGPS